VASLADSDRDEMTKMKASKSAKQGKAAKTPSVVNQLADIESSLSLSAGMTEPERKGQKSLSRNVPDKFIELVAEVATQGGGSVAGIPFDAAAATATLTYVSDAQKIADAAQGLALRVTDDAIQRRTAVANESFAVYSAMGRIVRTTKGKPLRQKYEEMQRLVRATHSKKTSADTTTQTDTPATTTVAADAPVAQQATTTAPQASTTTAAH
jgi:hypothetical protein